MARRDDWETPQRLFNYLHEVFNFKLDAAASPENAKCRLYYTKKCNALTKSWSVKPSEAVFCNPPYSMDQEFALKAYDEFVAFGRTSVLLLPVRSDRLWFQRLIHQPSVQTCWITGRLHFGASGKGAFMYSIIIYFSKTRQLPEYMQAGQFNDSGNGNAKT